MGRTLVGAAAVACAVLAVGCQSSGDHSGTLEGTTTPWERVPAAQFGAGNLPPKDPPHVTTRPVEPAVSVPPGPTVVPDPPGGAPVPTGPEAGAPDVAGVTASGVHIERHDGFDRIVYDFGGTYAPSWHAEYVAEATQRGRDTATLVAGRSILQIHFFDTVPSASSGIAAYSGPNPLTDAAARSVVEVFLTPNYQGATQSFVGLRGEYPQFQVQILAEPIRIAVDIYD